jgi:hypothetical protein
MDEEPFGAPPWRFVAKYWWVALFVCVCGTIYASSMRKKEDVISLLDAQLSKLQQESVELFETQQELLLQIESQSDPAWVELTLMKGLGLVPEGQSKVYFYHETP